MSPILLITVAALITSAALIALIFSAIALAQDARESIKTRITKE